MGRIPRSLCNASNLQILDVAYNNLTGIIPRCIGQLKGMVKRSQVPVHLHGTDSDENVIQTYTDPSIYAGNKYLCGPPLPGNCSIYEDPTTTHKKKYVAADEPAKVLWLFYMDIASGFATGFWGVIGILLFKKQLRWKLFRFAQKTTDKIYVAVTIRVAKMKRGREAT